MQALHRTASVVSSRSGSSNSSISNGRHHNAAATRNTCEVPGCGRVPRKSSDSARARFCTRHGGGRPCHYPGCQVAARGLLGFCYRHRHYANSSAAAYGNGVDGKPMPTPTPEATENDIRASRLESYVPVPSGIDSVELAALTYIASTLKASEAAASTPASTTASTDDSTPPAIQHSMSVMSPGSPFSPITTPSSPASSSAPSSPLLDSSNSQSLVPVESTTNSPVTTPSASDPIDAAFANHSSALCDIDELFSIPTMPPQRPAVFGVPPPSFTAKQSSSLLPPAAAAAVVGGATVACGPLGETPSLNEGGRASTTTVSGM